MPSTVYTDSALVSDIVDRLKKQGVFDKLRKECLADVDTKPAYQNLQIRVEGFVSRFLEAERWTPDLNKNKLRDKLRRQLTDSSILSSGVDRVVDQIVNYKAIKPQIDQVVCECLGIDPKKREEKQQQREEWQRQQQKIQQQQQQQQLLQQQQEGHQPQSNANNQTQNFPPMPSGSPGYLPGSTMPPLPGQPGFAPGVPNLMDLPFNMNTMCLPTGVPNIPTGVSASMASSMMNTIGSLNYPPPLFGGINPANPAMSYFNPMMPQTPQGQFYSGLQGSYLNPASMIPGLPFQTQVMGLQMPEMSSAMSGIPGNVSMTTTMASMDTSQSLASIIPPIGTISSSTVVKEEPPPPKEEKKKKLEPLTVEDLLNIPLPKPKETRKPKAETKPKKPEVKPEEKQIESSVEIPPESQETVITTEVVVDDVPPLIISNVVSQAETVDESQEEEGSSSKQYKFAWAQDGALSDVTISSVHTSDLSSFDEGSESSEEEESSVEDQSSMEDVPAVAPEVTEIQPVQVQPKKPQKLIALSYNYSDSDDDETREERKARIAKEKEERYLRRQQRRAELEAKRKEREEERARLREERRQAKEQSADAEESQDNEDDENVEVEVEIEESKEKKVESPKKEPKRRPRRTKQELKEQMREQKVMEKKMALRRQRTRNRRYMSEEFTSIFTEKKSFLASEYVEVEETVEQQVVEETVDLTQGVPDYESPPTPTQDEAYVCSIPDNEVVLTTDQTQIPIVEVTTMTTSNASQLGHMTRSQSKRLSDEKSGSRPDTPYSDISSDISLCKSDVVEEPKRKRGRPRKSEEQDSTGRQTPEVSGERRRNRRKTRSISTSDDSRSIRSKSPDESRAKVPQRTQRYETSDLYKPRYSWRRQPTPASESLFPVIGDLPDSQSLIQATVEYAGGSPEDVIDLCDDDEDSYKSRSSSHRRGQRSKSRSPTPERKPRRGRPPGSQSDRYSRRRSPPGEVSDRGKNWPLSSPPSKEIEPKASSSSQRYDESDLYKPHNPSTRASRYLSRASPEKEIGEKPIPDEEAADQRPKTPIDRVNFGLAAARAHIDVNPVIPNRPAKPARSEVKPMIPNRPAKPAKPGLAAEFGEAFWRSRMNRNVPPNANRMGPMRRGGMSPRGNPGSPRGQAFRQGYPSPFGPGLPGRPPQMASMGGPPKAGPDRDFRGWSSKGPRMNSPEREWRTKSHSSSQGSDDGEGPVSRSSVRSLSPDGYHRGASPESPRMRRPRSPGEYESPRAPIRGPPSPYSPPRTGRRPRSPDDESPRRLSRGMSPDEESPRPVRRLPSPEESGRRLYRSMSPDMDVPRPVRRIPSPEETGRRMHRGISTDEDSPRPGDRHPSPEEAGELPDSPGEEGPESPYDDGEWTRSSDHTSRSLVSDRHKAYKSSSPGAASLSHGRASSPEIGEVEEGEDVSSSDDRPSIKGTRLRRYNSPPGPSTPPPSSSRLPLGPRYRQRSDSDRSQSPPMVRRPRDRPNVNMGNDPPPLLPPKELRRQTRPPSPGLGFGMAYQLTRRAVSPTAGDRGMHGGRTGPGGQGQRPPSPMGNRRFRQSSPPLMREMRGSGGASSFVPPMTRGQRKRSEEEMLPVAKRLRR